MAWWLLPSLLFAALRASRPQCQGWRVSFDEGSLLGHRSLLLNAHLGVFLLSNVSFRFWSFATLFKTEDHSVDLVFLNKEKNRGHGKSCRNFFFGSRGSVLRRPASPPQAAGLREGVCDGGSFFPGCLQDCHLGVGKVVSSRVLPCSVQPRSEEE